MTYSKHVDFDTSLRTLSNGILGFITRRIIDTNKTNKSQISLDLWAQIIDVGSMLSISLLDLEFTWPLLRSDCQNTLTLSSEVVHLCEAGLLHSVGHGFISAARADGSAKIENTLNGSLGVNDPLTIIGSLVDD